MNSKGNTAAQPRPRNYVPDGQGGYRAAELFEWAEWFENAGESPFRTGGRRVADEMAADGVRVSTVFLGLDNNYTDSGDPLVFESMIFGGENDGDYARYTTLAGAESGHAQFVANAKAKGGP